MLAVILISIVVIIVFISISLISLIVFLEKSKKSNPENLASIVSSSKPGSPWLWVSHAVDGQATDVVVSSSGEITATIKNNVYKIKRNSKFVSFATKNSSVLSIQDAALIIIEESVPLENSCTIYRCNSDTDLNCNINSCVSNGTCSDITKIIQNPCFETGQFSVNKAKRICGSAQCIDSHGNTQKLNYIENNFYETCTMNGIKQCEGDLVFVQVNTTFLDVDVDTDQSANSNLDPNKNLVTLKTNKRKKFRVTKTSENSVYNFNVYDRRSNTFVVLSANSNGIPNIETPRLTINSTNNSKSFFQNAVKNPNPMTCAFDFVSVFTDSQISILSGITENNNLIPKLFYYTFTKYIVPLNINYNKNPSIYIDQNYSMGYTNIPLTPEENTEAIAFGNLFVSSVPNVWPDRTEFQDIDDSLVEEFFFNFGFSRVSFVLGFYEKFLNSSEFDKEYALNYDKTLFFKEFMINKFNANTDFGENNFNLSANISAIETNYLDRLFSSDLSDLKYFPYKFASLTDFESASTFYVFIKSLMTFAVTTNFINPKCIGWTNEQLYQIYYIFFKNLSVYNQWNSSSVQYSENGSVITTWSDFYQNSSTIYTIKENSNLLEFSPVKIKPVLNFEKDDVSFIFYNH